MTDPDKEWWERMKVLAGFLFLLGTWTLTLQILRGFARIHGWTPY